MSEGKLRRVWVIGFAGHRAIADSAATKAAILAGLCGFCENADGVVVGRASAAAGADLIFLECCRDLGLAYSVVLPFPKDRFRLDFDDDAEWTRAEGLMAAASNTEVAPGNEVAPEAYHLAAREILDVADAMLFFWDGQPARGIGGTAETLAEARERKMPLRVIEAGTRNLGPLESPRPFPWADAEFAALPAASGVRELFTTLDHRAVHGAPRSRWFAAGSISLNQLATIATAILVVFKLAENAAPAIKFLIVTVAAMLPWVGSRFRISDDWMEDRVHAELLRSLLASHSFSPPLRPIAADLFDEDAPFLRSAAWHLIGSRQDWRAAREGYLAGRLDGQIRYFTEKGEMAARRLRIFGALFKIASIGAMVLGAIAISAGLWKWQVPEGVNRILLNFLPTALPAVAAWCLAMIPLFEHKRRAKVYRRVADQLAGKRTELVEAKCYTTAAAVVASCERLLLTELWEWAGTRGKRKR
jgi:hypothetical protein